MCKPMISSSLCKNTCTCVHTPSGYQEVDLFSEIRLQPDFDNVFGGQQQVSNSSLVKPASVGTGQFTMGGVLQPVAVGPLASKELVSPQPVKLTKDVDSSLERAAANLSMSPITSPSLSASSWGSFDSQSPQSPAVVAAAASSKQQQQQKLLKSPLDDIVVPASLRAGNLVWK